MIQDADGIEKTLLYLIRNIQEEQNAVAFLSKELGKRNQHIRHLEGKLHEAKGRR